MDRLKVAIIGLGRSGRDIHGKHFKDEMRNHFFDIAAIVEIDEERRLRAAEEYPSCDTYSDYKELYKRDDIDLVVNATYSCDHYEITKDLLKNGMNVVVEKPFARNRYECDKLIRIAKENNVKLGVFQQSLLAPFFDGAKEAIASGKLGEIKQINITYSGFQRRWDWQTTQLKMGGSVYNTGPHPIGFALSLLDFDPDFEVVFSRLGRTLTIGDADDYAKIVITAPHKPVIDIEICSNDAYPAPIFKILGSKGTYKSSDNAYEMKYVVEGENPEREVQLEALSTDEGLPLYCKEELVTHEESGEFQGTAFNVGTQRFYEMMYYAITEDKPMEVTPEQAAMVISVIEHVHAENPLSVEI